MDKQYAYFEDRGGRWDEKLKKKNPKILWISTMSGHYWVLFFLSHRDTITRLSILNPKSLVDSRPPVRFSFLRAEIMLLQHKAHVFKPSTWTLFNIQCPWNVFLICDCLHQTHWLPGPYSRIITTIQWLEAALLSLPFLSLNHLPNLVCSRQAVWFYFCVRIYKDIISL